jgi:hypothetical protein
MPESSRTSLERGLASVVVGLVVAAVMIITVEPTLRSFYPVPQPGPGLSVERSQEMMASLPRFTFTLLWGLYAGASLVGGVAATLISGRVKSWPALTTGLVLMVAGTFGVLTVYQPLWFRLASLFTFPMAYLGYLMVRKTA